MVELCEIDARRPFGRVSHPGADHRERCAAITGQSCPCVSCDIECLRFRDIEQDSDFSDKFIQLALLLAVIVIAVVFCQYGEYIRRSIAVTRKRALSRETIKRICTADLSALHPKYSLARDIFMFSFFTRGMSLRSA